MPYDVEEAKRLIKEWLGHVPAWLPESFKKNDPKEGQS